MASAIIFWSKCQRPDIRQSIKEDNFYEYKKSFYKKYGYVKE